MKRAFNIFVDLRHIRNGNRHGVALLRGRSILSGDGSCALLVGYKAVHELPVGTAAGSILTEIQSIENSLDADLVKAVVAFRHVMNGGNGIVQQRKATAHITDVGSVLHRRLPWDTSSVEAQKDGRAVVFGPARKQRAKECQRYNKR